MKRYQLPFFQCFRGEIDPGARNGKQIPGPEFDPRVFDSKPQTHPEPVRGQLEEYYRELEAVAPRDDLRPGQPLLQRWRLGYDIWSPKYRRFIEIDERQHFSAVRLARIEGARESPIEANYPPYFWEKVLEERKAHPALDRHPMHRDWQRAYLDLCRELLPPFYGLEATLRIDEWSLTQFSARELLSGLGVEV